jgi:hypothetical protein
MYPVTITLDDAIAGDRWHGIASIGPVLFSGSQPTFPLARVRMQFRRGGRVAGLTLDSEPSPDRDAQISISSAETWLVHLPELKPLPLPPGLWEWDLEFYPSDSPDAPMTLFQGVLHVKKDTTRPPFN